MNATRRFDSLLVTSGRRTTARIIATVLGAGATWLAAPSAALAAPAALIGVYPTGVDDTGALLTTTSTDTHWTATTDDPDFTNPTPVYVFLTNTYPNNGIWAVPTSGQWLTLLPTDANVAAASTTIYETKIDLTGFIASTTSLSFDFAADNSATVWLNGNDTGISTTTFATLTSATISSGWLAGVNTLQFRVYNDPPGKNPAGLLVNTLAGTAEPDPADPDNDGLSNYIERVGGTDPTKADTDGDGIKDGDEDKNHNGVVDAGETDPKKADTDGDGFNDGFEIKWGGNPLDPSDAADMADDDNDGLPNKYETTIGTDPTKADTDGDGLKDGDEIGADIAHPRNTDGDDKIDALDNDDDGDGLLTKDELGNEDGGAARDTDGDGKPDYLDDDDDGDTILTKDEIADTNAAHVSDDVDGDGKKNWLDNDADGDGITDGVEGRGDSNGNGVPDYLDPTSTNGGDAGADGGAGEGDGGAGEGDGGTSTGRDGGADDGDGGTSTTSGGSSTGDLGGGGVSCSLSNANGGAAGGALLLAFGAIAGAFGLRRRQR